MNTHLRIDSARALFLTAVATTAAFASAQVQHQQLVSLSGSATDLFGWGFQTVRDLNGDGVRELVVGSPGYGNRVGRVQIFSGSGLAPIASRNGTLANGGIGYDFREADYNGDGQTDLVICNRWRSWPSNGPVEVIVASLPSLSTLWSKQGNGESWFGSTAELLPDRDADGLAEVFVMEQDNNCAGTDSGMAYVFGSSGSPWWQTCAIGQWDYWGAGKTSTVIPDVTGDGFPDICIPAPEVCSCVPGPGYVRVLNGANGSQAWVHQGDGWPSLASAARAAGRIDNDAIDDIAFVHGFDSPTLVLNNSVRWLSGANGSILFQVQVPYAYLMDVGPDVDGDGLRDVVVSTLRNGLASEIVVVSASTAGRLYSFTVPTFGTSYIDSLRWQNDFDGDGRLDIEVGCHGAGQVAIFSVAGLFAGTTSTYTPTQLTNLALAPGVGRHAAAALPSNGMLRFAGMDGSGTRSSTWTSTASGWTQQFPTFSPTGRSNHDLLLDPVRANNLLFGGANPVGAPLGDTWTWANGQWTFVSTATAPSARSGHRMAFDRARGVGILFGGKGSSNAPLGDTWSWNGTGWSQLSPAASPSARFDHDMAYDALRDRIVLYGGEDGSGLRSDLWEWNGTTWTQAAATTWNPGARARHAMEYDGRAERVVLFGGEMLASCRNDVWSWDGTEWLLHLTDATLVPSAVHSSQLVAEGPSGELLLLGGVCGTTYTSAAWSFDLPVFSRFASYGSGCAGTLGVPTLAVASGSKPVIGQTFSLEIGNIPGSPFNLPFGVFDLQRTTFAGLPIPADLSFVGLPGCSALTGSFWSMTLPTAGTSSSVAWPLTIPNLNAFLGQNLYLQAAILDNYGGRFASLTNGIEARMGNR